MSRIRTGVKSKNHNYTALLMRRDEIKDFLHNTPYPGSKDEDFYEKVNERNILWTSLDQVKTRIHNFEHSIPDLGYAKESPLSKNYWCSVRVRNYLIDSYSLVRATNPGLVDRSTKKDVVPVIEEI